MRIAIVKLSALGDIVHAMVVLELIKKYNQEIEIDWFVETGYKDLLEFNPNINNVYPIELKRAKKEKSFFLLLKELRKVSKLGFYDLVIDMQGLIKSAIISSFIPSKITIGFDKNSSRESFSSFFYNKTFECSYEKNIIERNLELIKFSLEINSENNFLDHKLPFLVTSRDHSFKDLSKLKKNILLVPGASHKSKRYPLKNLASLTNLIEANFIVIWGDDEEKKMADSIKLLAPKVIVSSKLSLDSLISLISQIDLLIGPDTGPTHIAWALNIPSIAIFGPTRGSRNACKTSINRIIQSDSIIDSKKIKKNDDSMRSIKIEDIARIAKNLLN